MDKFKVELRRPSPGEDTSGIPEAPSEVLPDMDELMQRAAFAGEAWGSVSAEAGHRLRELTPGNLFKMKSNAMSALKAARPDLSDEEIDSLATKFVDKFGGEMQKSL